MRASELAKLAEQARALADALERAAANDGSAATPSTPRRRVLVANDMDRAFAQRELARMNTPRRERR